MAIAILPLQTIEMPIKFSRPIPQLPVAEVEETQRYYRDVLGFSIDWIWEGNYGSVSRDEATIYFCTSDQPISVTWHILHVGDVDAVHAEWQKSGAKISGIPEDKPWGIREFSVEDNNGHSFRISQASTKYTRPDRENPTGLRLIHRLPTPDEHQSLVDAVGWDRFTNHEAAGASMPRSLFCVVAEIEGTFTGMARVVGDGQQFFYIMDVAVHPKHQGRGIGTSLMNEIVAFLQKTAPPKALVGLFTGANRGSFYERFGFRGPETGLYGMSARELHTA